MHMVKRIEVEVHNELFNVTGTRELRFQEVDPSQFYGIEVKPWAREIAELTLWIGFHQFWRRTHGDIQPEEPILRDTGTLANRDAVLDSSGTKRDPARDRQDPTPRLRHPVTGELVPDPAAKLEYRTIRIDTHRKAALARGNKVGMTIMYNVVDRLRSGEALTKAEREVHELAACGTLRDLHDELDRVVAEAYGWTWPEPPAVILERLVTLHDVRVEEERTGTVRWLRPDYQIARFGKQTEADIKVPRAEDDAAVAVAAPIARVPWPGDAIGPWRRSRSSAR